MIDKNQLRTLIKGILVNFDLHSGDAVNLLMGTAAQESHLGTYIMQQGGGPALGIFQMEPATEIDIWANYISGQPRLKEKIPEILGRKYPNVFALKTDLAYQIIMARIHYLRQAEPLPSDALGMARYWKKYYNTPKGKGTVEEFLLNYSRLVLS
jgi:hypothetical protein